jgi:hypothetical protein
MHKQRTVKVLNKITKLMSFSVSQKSKKQNLSIFQTLSIKSLDMIALSTWDHREKHKK